MGSMNKDCAGLVMWYGWTTSTYHSKHCTERFCESKEDPVGQGLTGETLSRKIYEDWTQLERGGDSGS